MKAQIRRRPNEKDYANNEAGDVMRKLDNRIFNQNQELRYLLAMRKRLVKGYRATARMENDVLQVQNM